jgi:hypothetical protein
MAVHMALLLLATTLLAAGPATARAALGGTAEHEQPGSVALDQGGLLAPAATATERWAPSGGGTHLPPKNQPTVDEGLVRHAGRRIRACTVQVAGVQQAVRVSLRRCRILFPFHFFW